MPGDKEELQILEIMNTVPVDAEERDKLLAIIHEARKYW
jgi:DNA-directed RNA polymerase subunit F